MKHRKSLLISIWAIAVGIILWFSGVIIGNAGIISYGIYSGYQYSSLYYLGVGMVWSAIIILVLGFFGIITTFIREYLDREQKPIQQPSSPPQQP